MSQFDVEQWYRSQHGWTPEQLHQKELGWSDQEVAQGYRDSPENTYRKYVGWTDQQIADYNRTNPDTPPAAPPAETEPEKKPVEPAVPPAGTSPADQSARGILNTALATYGLSSLGDTVWEWYKQGRSIEQIMLDIRGTAQYKARFPAMDALRQRGQAISEGTYIEFERTASQLWHAAGLPIEQIKQGDLVTKWLLGNVSVNEISHRIQDLYVRVAQVDPSVRQWYSNAFGPQGDAAIAASFADPTSAVPVLERRAAAAEFGGAGSRFGFNIGVDTGFQAAGVGVTAGQAQQGFAQLADQGALFTEAISERDDLTAEREGVGAVFGLDATSGTRVRRRTEERQAAFAGSAQAGGIQTNQGLGVGRARGNS